MFEDDGGGSGSEPTREETLAAIQKRFQEYEKHKSDPYSYYLGEITAFQELHANAPADIQFLLDETARLESLLRKLRCSYSELPCFR